MKVQARGAVGLLAIAAMAMGTVLALLRLARSRVPAIEAPRYLPLPADGLPGLAGFDGGRGAHSTWPSTSGLGLAQTSGLGVAQQSPPAMPEPTVASTAVDVHDAEPQADARAVEPPAGPDHPVGARRRWRFPFLAVLLLLIAAGLVSAATVLAPPSGTRLTGRDLGLVELRVDQPDVKAGVVLDASMIGSSSVVPVHILFDVPAEKTVHWRLVAHGVSLSADSAGETLTRTLEGAVAGPTNSFSDVAGNSFDVGSAGAPVAYLVVGNALVADGSQVEMQLPDVVLGRDLAQSDSSWQTGSTWYDPVAGYLAAIAPRTLDAYRTSVANPGEYRDGLWVSEGRLRVEWSGTDPVEERRERQRTLAVGLALGLAGAAVIGALQELARAWRRARGHDI